MKKFNAILAMTIASSLLLAGCGNSTNTTTNETTQTNIEEASLGNVLYTPDLNGVTVTLSDYDNIDTSSVQKYEVTDEDVQAQIDSILGYYADVTYLDEGVVEDGSIVYISFEGVMDGEVVQETTTDGYEIIIGSGVMMDGFEEGLIGASVGDVVTLDLVFPDYYDEEYAGKDVTFTVNILNLVNYDYPEWNDDFVTTNMEYASTQEYEDFLREDMQAYYDDSYIQSVGNVIIETLLLNSTVENLPEDEIAAYKQDGLDYYTSYADSAEIDLETFVTQYMGYDNYEDFDADLDEQTISDLSYKYIALAIAIEKDMVLTESDYEAYIQDMADYYGQSYDDMKTSIEEDGNIDDIYAAALCNKVIDSLR